MSGTTHLRSTWTAHCRSRKLAGGADTAAAAICVRIGRRTATACLKRLGFELSRNMIDKETHDTRREAVLELQRTHR